MEEFNKENENIEPVEAEEKVEPVNEEEFEMEENAEAEEMAKKKRIGREIFSWVRIIVIALAIALIINNFIIINANVPSGSMENTIMTGDRMIGLRTAYWFGNKPKRGQVIIFKFPDNEDETFVKRVIGLPGEGVFIKKGKIYINNSSTPLKEDYLKEEWTEGNDFEEPFIVPEDSYFCLGDNRNVSNDGRYWRKKYVARDKILAKAEFVYWPWSDRKIINTATYK